jgi:hypothetical protein
MSTSMIEKGWKTAAIVVAVVGLLGLCWGLAIWGRYWDILPRSPDPAAGRIYAFKMRGVTVYESLQERRFLNYVWNLSWTLFYAGFGLGVAERWKSSKRKQRLHGRMKQAGQIGS